jgi:hypothetical protein
MPAHAVSQAIAYAQKCIHECWEAQAELDDESPEHHDLDEQIKAYQDIHRFLTGDEFDGESGLDDGAPLDPDKVLAEDEPTPKPAEPSDEDEDNSDGTD